MTRPKLVAYHNHLDVCDQCKRHTWGHCDTGYKLLGEAAKEATEAVAGRGLAQWPTRTPEEVACMPEEDSSHEPLP